MWRSIDWVRPQVCCKMITSVSIGTLSHQNTAMARTGPARWGLWLVINLNVMGWYTGSPAHNITVTTITASQPSHSERSSPWSNLPTLNSLHWVLIRTNFRLCGWETKKMPGIDVKMMSYGERVPAQDRWLNHHASWWLFNRGNFRYNSEESLEDNQSTTSSTESRQSDFQKKVGPLNTMSMSTIMGKYCRIMSSYPQDPLE